MAIKPCKQQDPESAPIVSIITARALEQMLAAAGYQRIAASRLGSEAAQVRAWSGRRFYVILNGDRVLVGTSGSEDRRLRTTLRTIDCATVHLLKDNGQRSDEDW
jgi:hypothetical protein